MSRPEAASGGGMDVLTADAAEADDVVAAMTDQLGRTVTTLVYLVTRRTVRQVDHRLTTVTPPPSAAELIITRSASAAIIIIIISVVAVSSP